MREPNIGKHFALRVDGIRSKSLRPFGLLDPFAGAQTIPSMASRLVHFDVQVYLADKKMHPPLGPP